MHDWNTLSIVMAVLLFGLWNLELAATLLNLKSFPDSVPPELDDIMDPARLDQARAYLRANSSCRIVKSTTSLLVLLGFWFGGGFGWLDTTLRALSASPIQVGLLYLGSLAIAQSLLDLPFSIYQTFVIEERFGFNRATPRTFILDRLKGLLLALAIGLPLAAAVLWVFHHVAHAWLWAWLIVTVLQLALTWLAPTWIMPLFNRFTPMPDGELKEAINELGQRCEFPLSGVFIMDGSKRSSKANAFFTGFGKQKKIALFDTLIEKSTTPELLAILAHEIGHFRRGHIRQRLAAGIIQTGIIFFLLGVATDPSAPFARTLFDAFGVATISPHVGLILFSILLEPISQAMAVMLNAWSRRHEFEADAFAVTHSGGAAPLAAALKKMSADHLSHPSPAPLRVWLDYSHPPLRQRLRAMASLDAPY